MRLRISSGLLFAMLLGCAAPAMAHHSQSAEFYTDKTVTLKGVVTKVDWINPHIFIYMDVTDATGKTASYSLQSLPTRFYHNSGLTKQSLMGDGHQEITVTINPAKDGSNYGWVKKITFPDGKVFAATPEDVAAQQ